MNNEKIEKLKNEIIEYLKNGGNLYAGKRVLPYYEYLINCKKSLEAKTGKKFSVEDIYAMCDIKFDRDYNAFSILEDKMSRFADENNCVDTMRSSEMKRKDFTYSQLKSMANKYGVSPFDFLIFTSKFHFSHGQVFGDAVSKLKLDLANAYPLVDGVRDVTGIRRKNPQLYERIRSAFKCLPVQISMKDFADFLGVQNDYFSNNVSQKKVDEQEVLQQLKKMFPNGVVSGLSICDKTLYYKISILSLINDQTIEQWLLSHNFSYPVAKYGERLSKTTISYKERLSEIESIRKELLKKYDLSNADECDIFHINIEIMNKTLYLLGMEEENEK